MTRSQEYSKSKLSNTGTALCGVCGIKKADCVRIKKNWFSFIKICDSCGREILLSFNSRKKGVAK